MENENDTAGDKAKDLHIPVMKQEILANLQISSGGVVVDGTLGMGGHTEALAEMVGPQGRVVAIDRDQQAISLARRRLAPYADRITFVHDDFRRLDKILESLGIAAIDGLLLDLGLSSYQLNDAQRGFSFQGEGPLDMRMDQEESFSAFDLVNSLSEREISSILRIYGEERFHNRIASCLVRERQRRPLETTADLREVVLRALPSSYRRQKIHPATRTFQAFRIVVNSELEALENVLDRSLRVLKVRARMAVISFHSLEDRIVKIKFRTWAKAEQVVLLTKKPLSPSAGEVVQNSRSRSARLRVCEKI